MLHVLLGATCNNNCIFCMEADRAGRAAHIGSQSRDAIRAMISSCRSRDAILFTSGEPTLSPALLGHVRWASAEGFRLVGVISNGRRLSHLPFAEALVEQGTNHVTVSIHGHEPRLHDSLTRTPGSFAQTRAGLANLAQIKRRRFLLLHTSTVVNKRNLAHIDEIHRLLAQEPVERMVFNVMMPVGRGTRHLRSLMPAYSEVVDRFCRLAARLSPEERERVRLVDLPPCTARRLPPPLLGEAEPFLQFETVGSSGLAGLSLVRGKVEGCAASGDLDGPPAGKGPPGRPPDSSPWAAAITTPDLEADRGYYLTSRESKERFLRLRQGPCLACAAFDSCPGVYRAYTSAFGWEEIRPLRP